MDNTNRAPAPSHALRYLAALTLAKPQHDGVPYLVGVAAEVLMALDAAGCGNSIPGEIERRVESYLEERGVVVTDHGAEWTRAPSRFGCATCAYFQAPTDGRRSCAASADAIPALHSVPISCPLDKD